MNTLYVFVLQMILQEPDGERTYEFWCDDWVTTTDDQDGWKEIPLQENTDIMLPGKLG